MCDDFKIESVLLLILYFQYALCVCVCVLCIISSIVIAVHGGTSLLVIGISLLE